MNTDWSSVFFVLYYHHHNKKVLNSQFTFQLKFLFSFYKHKNENIA